MEEYTETKPSIKDEAGSPRGLNLWGFLFHLGQLAQGVLVNAVGLLLAVAD